MPPAVIGHNLIAIGAVVFGMQGIERIKAVLEALHFWGLTHHAVEQPAHQRQNPLFEFPAALGGPPVKATMGNRQAPNALNRVHTVANPGVSVVSVHGVCRAGGKQSAHGMLTL